MKLKLLIVDDEPAVRFGFNRYLARVGFEVSEAGSLEEGRRVLARERLDAILLDLNLPDGSGLDWIGELREQSPEVAIIVVTGIGDIPMAVEAMRKGADHFLTKPVNMQDLELFLKKSLELEGLRRKEAIQRRLTKPRESFWGESAAIRAVLDLAAVAAQNLSPVVLTGETGTGKGMLARTITDRGPRHDAPFVELNCSSMRGGLLASELFGHVRGAFTTAVDTRKGLLDVADGGTLFLDEIGDMELELQAQFLKVLEEKKYRRLGDVQERTSDFRLIAATNRPIEDDLASGRFRRDLYYRIHVFPIHLPPLRERREDLPGLVRFFLRQLGAGDAVVPPEVEQLLARYPWPGNVRELRNVTERALLLARGGALEVAHFPGLASGRASAPLPVPLPPRGRPTELSDQAVRGAIEAANGSVERAAKALGVSRATLFRRAKKIRDSSV